MHCVMCMDQRGGIGKNNALAWSIPADIKRFKSLTENKTVVMGSNTFFSLPRNVRPLTSSNRNVVVVTTQPYANKFDEYRQCPRMTLSRLEDVVLTDSVVLIGGAQLFELLYDRIDIFHLSVIHSTVDCDAFIRIDFSKWDMLHYEIFTDHTYYILKRTF
jgi:dihydrofolate reductase